jgi:hypothetical protein
MEQTQFIINAINSHITHILTVLFLSFLTITIASVFIKNKQEYETIVSDLYHERRKKTPLILINKNDKKSIKDSLDNDSYEVETHRDTIREKASWEEVIPNKNHQQNLEKLIEYEHLNKMIAKQTIERESSRNIAEEIAKIIQQRLLIEMNHQRTKNKALGVNSAHGYHKFKKLAEKGKLKGQNKATYIKQLKKELNESKTKARHNHAQKEIEHQITISQKKISI